MFEKYFSGIGMDFSEHHVRLAHVGCFGRVLALKEVVIPEGLVVDEKIADLEGLQKVLSKTASEMGFSGFNLRTTCLIPESRVFSFSFVLDASLKKEDFGIEARLRAQKEIPLNFEQAVTAIAQGAKEDGGIRTTLYAVEKPVVEGIEKTIDANDFQLIALESNTKSILRLFQFYAKGSCHKIPADKFIGILDIGHSWATLAFYTKDGAALFSRTVAYKQYGYANITEVVLPKEIVDSLLGIVEEAVIYFQTMKRSPDVFILAGVEADSAEILERMKKQLPASHVFLSGSILSNNEDEQKKHQIFGAAIGAALRSARPHTFSHQHNFFNVSL